jgi:TonB family protein
MLFARLLESQRAAVATEAMLEGAAASALAHGLLIGSWLFLNRDVDYVRPEPDATFTPVQWLVPKDQLPGRPQRESVTWTTLAARVGEGFAEEAKKTPRDERVEMVLPAGKSNETDAAAKTQEAQPPIALGDSIMTEFMVDSAVVRYEDGASPSYPESMLRRRIEGSVIVQYVVDTLGHADTLTFRVISATHADFARAVKSTLPRMRFRPAIMANRLVPQLVQQPFAFRIQDTTTARGRPPRVDRGESVLARYRLPSVTSSQ